jgi:hypothetical protein
MPDIWASKSLGPTIHDGKESKSGRSCEEKEEEASHSGGESRIG